MSEREQEIRVNVKGYHEMTFYPPYGNILVWRHKRLDAPGNAKCTEVEGMLLSEITALRGALERIEDYDVPLGRHGAPDDMLAVGEMKSIARTELEATDG